MPAFDVEKWRNDFPMLKKTMHGKPLIYFDSAATAQKPQQVIDAMTHFYQEEYGTVNRAIYELSLKSTEKFAQARVKVKQFLNASFSEEIIFTRGSTASINLLARSFSKAFIKPGDVILISAIEHHSNIVPWQMICEERGAQLKTIPVKQSGDLDLEAYKELLNLNVKLVSLAHVSNVLGTIHPIKEIIRLAHSKGAKVMIDGAQSVPHIKIDIQDMDADFFVFSGHKLYGPTGVGVLYGKRELLEILPPVDGGGDMIEKVTFEKTTYNQLPFKFEAGTPMIAEVIGLGAAIDYVSHIGMSSINVWEQELLKHLIEKLGQCSEVSLIGSPHEQGAIVSFAVKGIHPLDIATLLDFKGVAIRSGHHCSQPAMNLFNISSAARVSFGLYNTKDEIDLFVTFLKEIISKLS